jgi:exonuclease VII small subunit
MKVLKKTIAAALLLGIAASAFAITEAQVKQEAQTYLQQAKQQVTQNGSDYNDRNVSSGGNTAETKYKHLKNRIDVQGGVVDREKARIDAIISTGRTASPEDLGRYERAIAEYSRRVQELEMWSTAN